MEYEDRLTIATPEGVDVELVVAGLGSRFIAFLVDLVLQLVVILALRAGTLVLGDAGDLLWAVGSFAVFFAAPVAFETLTGGRTPGKRVAGLRVVRDDGSPVGFLASAIRNLVRLIDLLPALYSVGTVAVLVTRHHQRVGDLAAGTIVVRDRSARGRPRLDGAVLATPPPAIALPADAAGWDVSAVTAEEVGTVRSFLDRRDSLAPGARADLAAQLAARLLPKVVGPPTDGGPERFLELVVAAKLSR